MSKRRLGNEINELSDAILGDLEPDQRLQLLLSAQANGNKQRIDQLIESCPRYNSRAIDRAFTDRVWLAQRVAYRAVYDLHTMYLHYELTRQQQRYAWVLDYERDEEPSDEELDRASERDDELRELFAVLYISYHAHQRFATEVLEVDPETWLALHPEGPPVFEVVANVIDDQHEIDFAESYLNGLFEEDEVVDDETAEPDQTASDDDRVTLEDVAETRYEALARIWEDAITGIPRPRA